MRYLVLCSFVLSVLLSSSSFAYDRAYCRAAGCSGGGNPKVDLFCSDNGTEVLLSAAADELKFVFIDVYDKPLANSDISDMSAQKLKRYMIEGSFQDICDDLLTFCDNNNISLAHCKGLRMLYYIDGPLASYDVEFRNYVRPY